MRYLALLIASRSRMVSANEFPAMITLSTLEFCSLDVTQMALIPDWQIPPHFVLFAGYSHSQSHVTGDMQS